MEYSPTLALAGALALLLLLATVAALVWRRRARKLRLQNESLLEELDQARSAQASDIHASKMDSLTGMVAGLAHEINTPLGFVKSNMQVVQDLVGEHHERVDRYQRAVVALLRSRSASEEQRRKIQTAFKQAKQALEGDDALAESRTLLADAQEGLQQIGNLVRNLRSFSRLDEQGSDRLDVNSAIETSLNMAYYQLRDRFKVVKELGKVPEVSCVPSQINQVLLNLITNAAQAMGEEGGELRLMTRQHGGYVEIHVADSGPGIPEDVKPKIFDPFYTTKDVGQGTGLGLSIVHKIVRAHGGDIQCESTVGVGTRFIVRLPLELASEKTVQRPRVAGRARA